MHAAPGKLWLFLPFPIAVSYVKGRPEVLFEAGRMYARDPSFILPEGMPWEVNWQTAMQATMEYPGAHAEIYYGPRLFDDEAKEIEARQKQDEWDARLVAVLEHPARPKQFDLAMKLVPDMRLTVEAIGAHLLDAYLTDVSKGAHP